MAPTPSVSVPPSLDLSSVSGSEVRMESIPPAGPRSYSSRSSPGQPSPVNDAGNNNSGLKHDSSAESMEKKDVRGANDNGGSGRRRRQRRLADRNQLRMAARSPPTISEHQSLDHSTLSDKEKMSLSADITAEMTMLSAEEPDSATDSSVGVRKLPITPPMKDGLYSRGEPLPQSVSATTSPLSSPDQQMSPVPPGLSASVKNPSRDATSDSLPSSAHLPRRQRSQSLWDERRHPRQKAMKKIPTAPTLSPSMDIPKRLVKPKSKVSKPKLKRHATAPTSLATDDKQTNVVDDALMDRAFVIRQNLMNFEMQELAAEAERAAESGKEKFVGSASKFGVEETPPYRPRFVDDEEFVVNSTPGLTTPSRRKALVDTLAGEYTPSYFSRKKIPVTSLRSFAEIVPNFSDMHNNIRLHLGREGVDMNTLPDIHSRRSLVKNDTDDTRSTKEDGDDAVSQAPSVAASHAESVSSFSTFAAQSLSSIKEMIDAVNRSRTPFDNSLKQSLTMPNPSPRVPVPRDIQESSSLRNVSSDMGDSTTDRKRGSSDSITDRKRDSNPPLPPASTHFKAVPFADSDSDDSSVEFYGRKSPLNSSNQSVSSQLSGRLNQRLNSSNQSVSSQLSGRLSQRTAPLPQSHQPILQRRRKRSTGASVSFETEKANYEALLDRMQNKTSSPSVSFDVEQNSCGPSLTNLDIDILPSSSTIKSNKSTPMADFLSKLGNTFSRSKSEDAHHSSPKAADEDNKHFVSNFFYTDQPLDAVDPNSASNLKLEINPQRHREAYCLPGCEPTDILSACDVSAKYADKLLDWFGIAGADQRKSSAIIDPKSPDAAAHANWMKAWNSEGRGASQQRIFAPPKLSLRHAEAHDDDIFCSESKMRNECADALACPEVNEQIMGCSPG